MRRYLGASDPAAAMHDVVRDDLYGSVWFIIE